MVKRSIVLTLCAILIVGIPVSIRAQPTAKDTLIVAAGLDIVTIDPQVLTTIGGAGIVRNTYEQLVRYRRDTLEIEPVLATSWSVSQGGLAYTFNLRKGVKFHDGTDFTAGAVKYTFDRLFGIDAGPAFRFRMISRVEVVDNHTVRFRLRRPSPTFLPTMAGMYGSYVVSPAAFMAQDKGDWAQDWARRNVVGTGPYRLREWVPGERLVLERFDEYWGGWVADQPSRILFRDVRESSTQRELLLAGEVDVAERIQPEDIPLLRANPGVQIRRYSASLSDLIFFHTKRGPLANKKVRQALSYAVDYDSIMKIIMHGDAISLPGPLPRTIWGAMARPTYKYDIARARQLLAEAGYGKGGFGLGYMYVGLEIQRLIGEIIQAKWGELGVRVDLQPVTVTVGRRRREKQETSPDMFIFSTVLKYADPDSLIYDMFSSNSWPPKGNNWAWYKNDKVDDLLEKARWEFNQNRRTLLYSEAQNLIVEDAPAIFVQSRFEDIYARTNIQGLLYNPVYSRALNYYLVRKR